MRTATAAMFPQGEDLPLFSGTPQTVHESAFAPEEAAQQPRLPGMQLDWSQMAKDKSAR